jgi:hypothetical protein
MQIAINGQVVWQSPLTGFSCGQHGMSSAPTAIDMPVISIDASATPPATVDAARGPVRNPAIARIESTWRRSDQSFTTRNLS